MKKARKKPDPHLLRLRKAGLPDDYSTLNNEAKREARVAVLQSWFDPKKPHIFCTDPQKFVQAAYLWTEFHMKPSDLNQGVYFFDDPLCKYENVPSPGYSGGDTIPGMVSSLISPALVDTEPAKVILEAPRRLGKTQTTIIEILSMTLTVRPFSTCLIVELNEDRTCEELLKVRSQLEENEKIHGDFGGEGTIYEKSGSRKWTQKHLQMKHLPGTQLIAASIRSAHRGRGPVLGVVDDPEDDTITYSRDWRKKFFKDLYSIFLPMFSFGGRVIWIGTPIHKMSCLSQATRGCSEKDDAVSVVRDARFDDWIRIKIPAAYKVPDKSRETGVRWVVMQPDRWPEGSIERKLKLNYHATMAELLCEPVTPGTRCFGFDLRRHGYMKCLDAKGEFYFLDLLNGVTLPWQHFLDELVIFGACDLADLGDGKSADSDFGALVFLGIDPVGVIYVIDAFVKQDYAEKFIELSCILGEMWRAEQFGWEKVAMTTIVNRMIFRYAEALMKEGKSLPEMVEVENANKRKISRIMTMIPLFGNHEIRFLHLSPFTDTKGVTHNPAPYERASCYQELVDQVQDFTDEGLRGPDDAIDALEMAVRISAGARGERRPPEDNYSLKEVMNVYEKAGNPLSWEQIPRECWDEEIVQKSLRIGERTVISEVIPYV